MYDFGTERDDLALLAIKAFMFGESIRVLAQEKDLMSPQELVRIPSPKRLTGIDRPSQEKFQRALSQS